MTKQQSDLVELYSRILADPQLDPEQKKMMFNEVRKLIPAEQNRWTFRWVVWFLGAVVLSVPAYALCSLFRGVPLAAMPEALLSIGSTALGALATFLTHYTRGAGEGKELAEVTAGQSDKRSSPPIVLDDPGQNHPPPTLVAPPTA